MALPDASMTIDKQNYRQAMSSLGSAVNIVTSAGASGPAGCTVSSVCSVTDEPPTLLVCINRESRNAAAFREAGALCVNIANADQQALAQRFADKAVSVEQRFGAATWRTLHTGAPVLDGALASLDCSIESVITVGTHDLFLCAVKALHSGSEDGDALIYFGRRFHRLAAGRPATP